MSRVLILLKTQNLRTDQRVLKEINSLKLTGANVEVCASTNCNMTEAELGCPIHSIKIIGGAAPDNLILRIIGVLQFYLFVIFFLRKKQYDIFWVCDPIMFGLIFLLKTTKPKVKTIWDHHELPPGWFLKNKFLVRSFKKVYEKTDILIHTNTSRKNYLEGILGIKAKKSYILSNYPENKILNEDPLDFDAENWLRQNSRFVYLQNSLQDNRYGAEVIKALLEKGFKVFHAGKINKLYLKENDLEDVDLYLAGYLNPNQINRVLNKCEFTVIFYRQDSLNQIYCDANRLYQSMALGVPLIIGNNPTLIESTQIYRDVVVVEKIEHNKLISAIQLMEFKIGTFQERKSINFNWFSYGEIFEEIIKK